MKKINMVMRNQVGFSLVESLVALGILGICGVALLSGLITTTKTAPIADEKSTAQNLAERQVEFTRQQDYDYFRNPPQYETITNIPHGYSVTQVASRLDPDGDGTNDDDGIQKVTVTINRGEKTVTALVTYRTRQ